MNRQQKKAAEVLSGYLRAKREIERIDSVLEEYNKTGMPAQKNEQRYTCSRNLKKPKEKRIRKNIKADQWTGEPKAKDGYHIITDYIYNGFDRFGFPYMHYYMVKDKPKPEDWKDEKPCKVQGKTIKRRRRNNP